MKVYKNKLVIIGNGFDLAHELKTSYNDFIKWYLNQVVSKIDFNAYKFKYEDSILIYEYNPLSQNFYNLSNIEDKDKVDWFLNEIKKPQFIEFSKISSLLEKLIHQSVEYRWVDIEGEFYDLLISTFEKGKMQSRRWLIGEIIELNAQFEFIKIKLEEYLYSLNYILFKPNQDINSLFQSDYCIGYIKEEENYKSIHYLNFNYTETIKKYIWPQSNYELNFIHGELKSITNPIIFGYGDEIDKYYEEIQNLNINEFLNNFKSFGYFKTDNYSNLLRFIESEPFDVEILGHSCGLSDRVLLNTIFEHDNCVSIKIHYYQKSEKENDFLSKTQEISRHFKDKAKMRKRIVNFKDCSPLVKFRK